MYATKIDVKIDGRKGGSPVWRLLRKRVDRILHLRVPLGPKHRCRGGLSCPDGMGVCDGHEDVSRSSPVDTVGGLFEVDGGPGVGMLCVLSLSMSK